MKSSFKGVIIEESLEDKAVLKHVQINSTKIEQVTQKHKTPWVKQWTLHSVEIEEEKVEEIAQVLSGALDLEHAWYADFKNNQFHYIVFRNKVFKVDREKIDEYEDVTHYGISIGIPDYQVDFSPQAKRWER
ncbi:hypothetical protein KJ705_03050 [Patescibacteria group bacterium]|nr:hypothetical protein [Patescibacteria group bacterium]